MPALAEGTEVTHELVLTRQLGAGAMGAVWVAEHRKLESEVVVKFLSESLLTSESARTRFTREAKATSKARSPHVVQLLDYGITEDGVPFLVMEHLLGIDLAKRLRREPLRADEVAHVVDGVAQALAAAHEHGIVHRDVKPANIFLCDASPRPFVKLLDFGVAKRAEDLTLTGTNGLVGTPAYMSPEQLRSDGELDYRSDLWALGVLVFHMLTGKVPFFGANVALIRDAVMGTSRSSVRALRPDLLPAVDVWMDRALAFDPSTRFGSALEMSAALSDALVGVSGAVAVKVDPVAPAPASIGPSTLPDSPATRRNANVDPRRLAPPRWHRRRSTVALAATAAAGVFMVAGVLRGRTSLGHQQPVDEHAMAAGEAATATAGEAAAAAPPGPPPAPSSASAMAPPGGRLIGASPAAATTPSSSTTPTRTRRAAPAAPPPPGPSPSTTPARTRAKRGRIDDDDVGF